MTGPNPFSGHAPVPTTGARSLMQGPREGTGQEHTAPVLLMSPPQPEPSKAERWRRRTFLVIFVLFSLEVGIILTVAPWTTFWTNNPLLIGFPKLREFLVNDFVRGVVTGLGVTDIGLAIVEAVRFR